jgi:hypothetical protein
MGTEQHLPPKSMAIHRVMPHLSKIVGEAKAKSLVGECLEEAGLVDVGNPQDLLRFSQTLMKRGGFIEIVARSIKAQALMGGACLPS